VAHRFRQQPEITFGDRYSPTISHVAIHVVLSNAVVEDKKITPLNIITRFLESSIEVELDLKLAKHFTMAKKR